MTDKTILIGVANEGEFNFNLHDVKNWEPTNVCKFGEYVFFNNKDTYYSMKTLIFMEIFGEKQLNNIKK